MSNLPSTSQIVEIQGEALTGLDRFWLDAARSAAHESIGALEEAAKQLITITSLSQGIYLAAVSLSDVRKTLGQYSTANQWLIVTILVLPLISWFMSLVYAIRVFSPETYRTDLESPDLAREMYDEIATYKHKQLRRAHLWLMLSFVPLTINVMMYLIILR